MSFICSKNPLESLPALHSNFFTIFWFQFFYLPNPSFSYFTWLLTILFAITEKLYPKLFPPHNRNYQTKQRKKQQQHLQSNYNPKLKISRTKESRKKKRNIVRASHVAFLAKNSTYERRGGRISECVMYVWRKESGGNCAREAVEGEGGEGRRSH